MPFGSRAPSPLLPASAPNRRPAERQSLPQRLRASAASTPAQRAEGIEHYDYQETGHSRTCSTRKGIPLLGRDQRHGSGLRRAARDVRPHRRRKRRGAADRIARAHDRSALGARGAHGRRNAPGDHRLVVLQRRSPLADQQPGCRPLHPDGILQVPRRQGHRRADGQPARRRSDDAEPVLPCGEVRPARAVPHRLGRRQRLRHRGRSGPAQDRSHAEEIPEAQAHRPQPEMVG